ncbi:MAG: hypothetical protein AAGH83_11215, partial [Pseudomonadota bacterium]
MEFEAALVRRMSPPVEALSKSFMGFLLSVSPSPKERLVERVAVERADEALCLAIHFLDSAPAIGARDPIAVDVGGSFLRLGRLRGVASLQARWHQGDTIAERVVAGESREIVLGRCDLPPDIRAIAKWNFPPLNERRRKTHEAEAFHRRTDHRRAEGERGGR